MNEKLTLNEYNKTLLAWFKRNVYSEPNVSNTLLRLPNTPNSVWSDVNFGHFFHTNLCRTLFWSNLKYKFLCQRFRPT